MNRLTKKDKKGNYVYIEDIVAIEFNEDYSIKENKSFIIHSDKAIDKLAEYEDLEEQERLIKLPCVIGDTVYFITTELNIATGSLNKVIDEYIVTEIRGNKYNPLWYMASSEKCTHRDFHPTSIGRSVFLTQKEAEEYLKANKS